MTKGNLLTRSDTMLGICQGLGEDLGFNPNWLRVALGISLVWRPEITVAIYLALGLIVLASRLLVPVKSVPQDASEAPAEQLAARNAENDTEAFARAA